MGEVQLERPLFLVPLVIHRSEDPRVLVPLVLVPLVPRRSGDPLLPVPLVPLVPTCANLMYHWNLCQLSILRFFVGFPNVIPFFEKLF